MPRWIFKVRTLAEAQGKNMSQLQMDARVSMGTVRRYWYGTKDGKEEGKPLTEIDLIVLNKLAKPLGVGSFDLVEEIDRLAPVRAQRLGNEQRAPAGL